MDVLFHLRASQRGNSLWPPISPSQCPPIFGRETPTDTSTCCDISTSGLRHILRFPRPRTFSLHHRRHKTRRPLSAPGAEPDGLLSWAPILSGFPLGLALGLWLQVRDGRRVRCECPCHSISPGPSPWACCVPGLKVTSPSAALSLGFPPPRLWQCYFPVIPSA